MTASTIVKALFFYSPFFEEFQRSVRGWIIYVRIFVPIMTLTHARGLQAELVPLSPTPIRFPAKTPDIPTIHTHSPIGREPEGNRMVCPTGGGFDVKNVCVTIVSFVTSKA